MWRGVCWCYWSVRTGILLGYYYARMRRFDRGFFVNYQRFLAFNLMMRTRTRTECNRLYLAIFPQPAKNIKVCDSNYLLLQNLHLSIAKHCLEQVELFESISIEQLRWNLKVAFDFWIFLSAKQLKSLVDRALHTRKVRCNLHPAG
jgi:hypothetical protein